MAKAHDLGLLRQGIHHPFLRAIGRPDVVEHFHRLLVGAAVERAFERSAGARDRGIHVGQGRSRDARGKSRGVEFVIGIENQNRVHHPELPILRHFAVQLVEKIARHGQVRVLRQGIQA